MCRLLFLAIYCVLQFFDTHAKFILEDVICRIEDKQYISYVDAYITDDSDNALVGNITFIKEMPESVEAHFVLLSATMGQYIVPTGFDLTAPLCELANEPLLIGPAIRMIGITEDNCPPRPGYYGIERYIPPPEELPDGFPPGKYLAATELFDGSNMIIAADLYVQVL